MRRLPFAATLLLALSSLPALISMDLFAQRGPTAGVTTTVSPEAEHLRASARDLLRSGSPEGTEKAADLLLKASQIDAQNAQAAKDNAERHTLEQPPRESWKTLTTAFTPMASTLIVAGTLFFNIYQGRVAEREKRSDRVRQEESDERKRLVDALELIQKSENVCPTATLINTFTTEPFHSQAIAVGKVVLLRSKYYQNFLDLFRSIYDPVTPANFPEVLELLRSVSSSVSPLLTKSWTGSNNDISRLTHDEAIDYDLLVKERMFLGEQVAGFLRQQRSSPFNNLDLNSVGFDRLNLSGADLRGAVLTGAVWNYVNLDGTDLSGITEFNGFWLQLTPWWHAAKIELSFLAYLKDKFAYVEGQTANSRQPVSDRDYAENIIRLEALHATGPSSPRS